MSNSKYQLSALQKKGYVSDLKAEYLYICVPFLILILVKIYFGPLRDIIYTSDWSLAASIILGQNAAKISRSISQVKQKINDSNFSWYSAKRFIFVIVALFFLFWNDLQTKYLYCLFPDLYIPNCQLVTFFRWIYNKDAREASEK
ncbi:hypothetical protein LWT90_21890 [Enterobacter hormaechei]|nr:hypothetical protein [Enterobacter hormaechei]